MKVFSASDIGTRRQFNQDFFVNTSLRQDAVLSVVCDGMGGANAGHIASNMAANLITEYVKRSFVPDMNESSIKNLLSSAIKTANSEIYEKAKGEEEYFGMGTTAVVALVIKDKAYIAHVGDSRAYLISNDSATLLTKDHSVIQTLIDGGHITEAEAKTHPEKNVITRAIGTAEDVASDFTDISLNNGLLLLCTDGISNVINADMLKNKAAEIGLEDLPKSLIELANSLDSGDNVTVTVLNLDL